MLILKYSFAVLGTAVILSGCSVGDAVWPSLTGDSEPTGPRSAVTPAPEAAPARAVPSPDTVPQSAEVISAQANAASPLVDSSPTGTYVGTQVETLKADVNKLKQAIVRHSEDLQSLRGRTVTYSETYHRFVADINARLQVGTTPGNPVLVQKWNAAQEQLDRVNDEIATLNELSNRVAADSSLSAFMLDRVRGAYQVSGAVDEDHRQLDLVADDVNRTVVLVDRLLNEVAEDLARQTTYVSGERSNLNTLALAIKNGELFGAALSERGFASAGLGVGRAASAPVAPAPALAQGRPLVVIRFNQPNVRYEQALYTAISRALERRPQARFDVVAVTPNSGTPAEVARAEVGAKKNAQDVLRSLTDMGLPSTRVALSSAQNTNAASNEVHIFVR